VIYVMEDVKGVEMEIMRMNVVWKKNNNFVEE
jgi:hypothetical protein